MGAYHLWKPRKSPSSSQKVTSTSWKHEGEPWRCDTPLAAPDQNAVIAIAIKVSAAGVSAGSIGEMAMSNVQDRQIQRDPTRSLVPVPVDALRPEAVCHLPEQGAPPLFIDKAGGIDLTTDAFISWVEAKRHVLDALILAHGGIVLRGFPMRTAEQFNTLVGLFPGFQNGYAAGMSPDRKSVV